MNVRPVCLQGDFTDLQVCTCLLFRHTGRDPGAAAAQSTYLSTTGSGLTLAARRPTIRYTKQPWGAHMPKFFAATLVALAAMLATPEIASAQIKLRIAGNFTLDHSSTIAIEQFKKAVEAATGNAVI